MTRQPRSVRVRAAAQQPPAAQRPEPPRRRPAPPGLAEAMAARDSLYLEILSAEPEIYVANVDLRRGWELVYRGPRDLHISSWGGYPVRWIASAIVGK